MEMGRRDDRIVRRLEAQIAAVQRRLGDGGGRGFGWAGFLGGVALGTLAGAALALVFAGRNEEEPIEALPRGDDAIVLGERSQSARERTTSPQDTTVAAVPDDAGVVDEVAAAELEDPRALAEIAEQEEASAPAEAEAGESATAGAAATPGKVAPVDGSCPASHPIKGNHSSGGDYIYHVPGSPNYSRTNPEVCFATEADAEAAGYRAPRG
jgi:hypothetical protein